MTAPRGGGIERKKGANNVGDLPHSRLGLDDNLVDGLLGLGVDDGVGHSDGETGLEQPVVDGLRGGWNIARGVIGGRLWDRFGPKYFAFT